MENLALQKATNNDWEILATIEKESSSKFFHALTQEKEIKDYIKDSEVFFITLDNQKIGTVSYEKKEKNSIYFNGLTIIKKYRRKGIASWAIENILSNIKNKKTMSLLVHPKNTPAILVYLKAGFSIHGWENDGFGDGEPRLSLIK